MIFEFEQLRAFYQAILDVAPIRPLSDSQPESGSESSADDQAPAAFVRHDVDLDVRPAYDLYVLERALGIRTTFLFLTTCHSYNVTSAKNRAMIREMADAGFDVGLHFDPSLYEGDTAEALAPHVRREASILEDVTGRPVRSISLHNPTSHGQYPLFPGLVNAYEPPLFDPAYYLADSCRSFRGKDPFRFIEKLRERSVQILLHPLHFSESGDGYAGIMARFFAGFASAVDQQLRPYNPTYASECAQDEPPA